MNEDLRGTGLPEDNGDDWDFVGWYYYDHPLDLPKIMLGCNSCLDLGCLWPLAWTIMIVSLVATGYILGHYIFK